jgi:hypothetical protein
VADAALALDERHDLRLLGPCVKVRFGAEVLAGRPKALDASSMPSRWTSDVQAWRD